MKKTLLITGLALAVMVAVVVSVVYTTKSHSPASLTSYVKGNVKISVTYNSPFKKGRKIFGGLVPYGNTWRTGANEPTVFDTDRPLLFGDKLLKPGRYSLWTVPNEENWQVVFNSVVPPWGINVIKHGVANRNPETDVLIVDVPVMTTEKEFEKFTISIEEADDMLELVLAWDRTLVAVPFSVSE
jgi:hypothetical protein